MATNPSLKYTDDQLRQVLIDAAADGDVIIDVEGYSTFIARAEITDLRRILSYLPDQQDEWQECTFDEIRKGDRVKRVLTRPNGSIVTKEGVAHLLDGQIWDTQDGVSLASPHHIPASEGKVDIYRIPAPVVRPDPEEHPVIIVHESTVLPKGSEPQKVMFIRPYYRNDIWNGAPDTITDWSPAKVVADE